MSAPWPPPNDSYLGEDGNLYRGRLPDRVPPQPTVAPPTPSSEVRGPGRPPKEKPAKQPPRLGQTVIYPEAPYDVAKLFCSIHYLSPDGASQILFHRGEFYEFNGAAFATIDDGTIKKLLYAWLASCFRYNSENELVPVLPNPRMVGAVLDGLKACCHIRSDIEPPQWLRAHEFAARHLICARNGYLHWPNGQVLTPTPWLFNANAVDFNYDPSAPPPRVFLEFLASVWADQQTIDTLQEFFGYCLTGDTSQQKIVLLKGPRRSGKSLIGRVLAELVGKSNVCAPTLNSLGTEFGLQPLINKRVAIIGDARLGQRSDVASITERLLSISGEDMMNVNRKNSSFWIGTLRTRVLVITNELPRLSDTSSALPGRFIILVLTKSFFGQEDRSLFDRIMLELPGVLNWALEGLRRLQARGYFIQPKSSYEAAETMEELASPMLAFVRDAYEENNQGGKVLCDEFCTNFRRWSDAQGREFKGTNGLIGSMLGDVMPSVVTRQLRTGVTQAGGNHARQRWFIGIQPRQS